MHSIATLVPSVSRNQSAVLDLMLERLDPPRKIRRYLKSLYNRSEITKRHSILDDFEAFHFSDPTPSTAVRNRIFADTAREISLQLTRDCVHSTPAFEPRDITHIITVSCTGSHNPGPECHVIEKLNLNPDIQRFNIGFMGCHAAFPAMRLAHHICASDPAAVVLILCIELCTLHAQITHDPNTLRANAIFADGAAAAIVSSAQTAPDRPALELNHFASSLIPGTADEMTWTIGDTGFDMKLSAKLPDILARNLEKAIAPVFAANLLSVADIDHWAVHPASRAVLDKVERSLRLQNRLTESRSVLSRCGNMASPTILFILQEILHKPAPGLRPMVFAMAFGPGLTVESAIMTKIPVQKDFKTDPALVKTGTKHFNTPDNRILTETSSREH